MSSSNPRKMAPQWAEKEFRNLKRLVLSGLRCPVPIQLRGHVFLMSMIGMSSDNAAPRLKDLLCDCVATWKRCYLEVVAMMRIFYKACKLVHGDLSGYNLLFHCGHPYMIDVSQSMETSSNNSHRYLRRDIINVTKWFNEKIFGPGNEGVGVAKSDNDDDDSSESEESCSSSSESYFSGDESEEDALTGGGLLYNRALRSNKITEFEESQHIIAKMDKIGGLFSFDELFDFVTEEKADVLPEDPWWPEYDHVERDRDYLMLATAQPREVTAEGGTVDVSTATHLKALDPKSITNAFVDRIVMTAAEFKERREHFKALCQATYDRLFETTRDPNRQAVLGVGEQAVSVFADMLEPDSLAEIPNVMEVERQMNLYAKGEKTKYTRLLGATLKEPKKDEVHDTEDVVSSEETAASDDDSGESGDEENLPADEKARRKEHKRQVKEANRLRRQTKMKKHIKKAKINKRKHK
eukprot:Blabericola_migrator_1__7333@NODE_372_length_9256_cov_73_169986_g297_i0_p1_GENE_NODE_372_length_9256_cov_73_169986_g297_i0NODE_372_length_9256_cov_73_169986_g297_i0_p1_ORF_typecomplete_len467_score98_32RIO1/PF01163_22/1_2e43RIO1/PF01163_22/8_9e03Kdo/PF06293_14/2_6e06Fructosamin_kin/PF03881_14/2_6e02Fructosamin_kin/PF03881_14/1_1Fructosamin_kin/PF03881_14/2_3e03WaaY/PF06176_11/0_17YL1/PF05764_13/44YL1/PF05764_13/0_059SR25/PF10500_9/25SR25/PF10500_9/3_9_NODE_372_length_9256_cov_73_169986_g297_i051